MVNLGNTLFAKSQAMRLAQIAQKREERDKAMQLALETTRDIEAQKDRDFERQTAMAEREGLLSALTGAPAPASRNERIAQALNLGQLGGRAQRMQTREERAYRTGEREAGQTFGAQQGEVGFGRQKDMAKIQHDYAMDRLRESLKREKAQRKAIAEGRRPQLLRDEMKFSLGNFNSWARNLGQKERLDIATDPNTGALQILSTPADPNRRATAELIATANNIAYGAGSPSQVAHLMYMLTTGATAQQLEEWWMGGGVRGLSPEQVQTPYTAEKGQGPLREPLQPVGDTDQDVMDAIRGGAFEYEDEGPSVKGRR